jgi:hypothetical protein
MIALNSDMLVTTDVTDRFKLLLEYGAREHAASLSSVAAYVE